MTTPDEPTFEMPPGDDPGCANGCNAPFGVRCSVCNTDKRAEVDWTAEHFRVTDEAIRILRKSIKTIAHFLTPEEHAELNADLAEMVRLRRDAEMRSGHFVVGGGES